MRKAGAGNPSPQPDFFAGEALADGPVAGVDEAGRGPLCGPVTAAAVILDPARPVEGLRDSKKLSEREREALAPLIRERAAAWAVAEASPGEIDSLNILQATMLAMQRAVEKLSARLEPALVLVDGNRVPHLRYPCAAVVKGDDRVEAISAASILAKTTRDALLREYDRRYPQYGFAAHKGYGTAAHLEAIRRHGLVPGFYRCSFRPVAEILAAGGNKKED